MPEQRYERIANHDDLDSPLSPNPSAPFPIPNSPPPSFHSRASSPTHGASRRLLSDDPLATDADRTLADTFDSPSDEDDSDDEEGDGMDDRQRLMRGQPADSPVLAQGEDNPRQTIQRRVTQLPVFNPVAPTQGGRIYGGGQNDGVFANLSAKPTRGEDLEEKPPTYEQAAADATPPYWETTILAPGTFGDEVFVEGLPVGSVFSFVWNAMISMSFQLPGFLLTYLLHTTHAAKNGSRAGLGITLVQYGFTMKGASNLTPSPDSPADGGFSGAPPSDPNGHDFDPNAMNGATSSIESSVGSGGISTSDWLAYGLMIVGWFILIKSVSDFVKARRHEQLVLQSPDRGLGVAIVAEGESPERAV
ncbi:metal homeostatis protein bsd2 [Amniculicola lignicola CBS 123094]|uniref:Metal homeostatis protein bsd2 n=1 Tax=Amniculicola lignicola CBS 123094 TaxID=1392246 RepID=A0A6A5WHZ3_9PLEO|nr:metal homeostatis protein bsd2 [Amniculicola lignicola CBS 123094]